jgi:hypothetical protein
MKHKNNDNIVKKTKILINAEPIITAFVIASMTLLVI